MLAVLAPQRCPNLAKQSRSGKAHLGLWLLGITVTCVLLAFFVGIFGNVSGEEFSAQKFAIRKFQYWQLPFVRVQVWPISFSKVGGTEDALAKHIRTNRLNGDISQTEVRWDVVSINEVGRQLRRGDAAVLTNYLQQPGATGTQTWLDWSSKNPELASELWYLVAQLADAQLYIVIPDILDVARTKETVTKTDFGASLRTVAARACEQVALAHDVDGNGDRAKAIRSLIHSWKTDSIEGTRKSD